MRSEFPFDGRRSADRMSDAEEVYLAIISPRGSPIPPAEGGQTGFRGKIQLPARYSPGYPVKNGHNHLVRSIPVDLGGRRKRAHAEERAMRNVVIVAPDFYAAGRLTPLSARQRPAITPQGRMRGSTTVVMVENRNETRDCHRRCCCRVRGLGRLDSLLAGRRQLRADPRRASTAPTFARTQKPWPEHRLQEPNPRGDRAGELRHRP